MWRRVLLGMLCFCLALLVTSCGEPAAVSKPAAPDAAVRAIFVGLADHQPAVVWDAMPASWQADVNSLIHLLVSQQDPELFDRSTAFLQRAYGALHHNEALRQHIRAKVIATNQLEPEIVDLVEVGLADLAVVGRVLADSDLSTHATASRMDLGDALRAAGPELMPIAFRWADRVRQWQGAEWPEPSSEWQRLREVEVVTLSQSDAAAVVEVRLSDRRWPLDLVLVEGKWVPVGVAAHWKSKIEQQRAFAHAIYVPMTEQERELALIKVETAEAFVALLEQAQSVEELLGSGEGTFASFIERVEALGPFDETAMQERQSRFVAAMGYASEEEMLAAMEAKHAQRR